MEPSFHDLLQALRIAQVQLSLDEERFREAGYGISQDAANDCRRVLDRIKALIPFRPTELSNG